MVDSCLPILLGISAGQILFDSCFVLTIRVRHSAKTVFCWYTANQGFSAGQIMFDSGEVLGVSIAPAPPPFVATTLVTLEPR